MPTLEGVKPGEKVNMTIRMYFGLTEIKIECVIKDKIIVFTSAFEASEGAGQESAGMGYVQDAYGGGVPPPPGPGQIGMDPYGTPSMNASQASFAAYPPYGGAPPPTQQQQPAYSQAAGAYPPSTTYGAYPPAGGAYPADDNYYQQPYADPQGYPPQQQQQQQGYYGAGGYPPTSQGYPHQGGYSGYQ
jgi:hypothetical protein